MRSKSAQCKTAELPKTLKNSWYIRCVIEIDNILQRTHAKPVNRYLTPREALFIIIVRRYKNARTCAEIFRLPAVRRAERVQF